MYTTQFYRKKHESRRAGAAAGARDARAGGEISATTDDECPTSERIDDTSATSNIVHACHHNAPHRMRSAARRLDMALAAHVVSVSRFPPRLARESPARRRSRSLGVNPRPEGCPSPSRVFLGRARDVPERPPPVTHLLTAYDMSAAPAMQVTPCGSRGRARSAPASSGPGCGARFGSRETCAGKASVPRPSSSRPRVPGARASRSGWARGRGDGRRRGVPAHGKRRVRAGGGADARAGRGAARRPARGSRRAAPRFCARRSTRTRRRRWPPRAGSRFPGPATTARRLSRRRIVITKLPPRSRRRSIWRTAARAARELRSVASARARSLEPHGAGPAGLAGPALRKAVRSGLEVVAIGGPPLVGTLLLEGDDGAPNAGAWGTRAPS